MIVSHKLHKPGQCIHKVTVDTTEWLSSDFVTLHRWLEKKACKKYKFRETFDQEARKWGLLIWFEDPKIATSCTIRFG
jgi:hypothetical protein